MSKRLKYSSKLEAIFGKTKVRGSVEDRLDHFQHWDTWVVADFPAVFFHTCNFDICHENFVMKH